MSTEEEEITAAGSVLSSPIPAGPSPEIPPDPIFSTGTITTPSSVRSSIGGVGNVNGSRHVRYYQHHIRGEKRSLPMYGEGDDRGKYFRCWNCGFICNIDRDALGDGDGRTYTEFGVTTDDLYPIDDGGPPLVAVLTGIAVLKRDGYQVGGTGCPLCHTLNWKG